MQGLLQKIWVVFQVILHDLFLFYLVLPDCLMGTLKLWSDKGLFRSADIVDYKTSRVLLFESLKSIFKLPERCRYSDFQNCMRRALSSDVVSIPPRFEKGLISDIYRLLIDQHLICHLDIPTWINGTHT